MKYEIFKLRGLEMKKKKKKKRKKKRKKKLFLI